ncbi:hypothetical protein ACH4U6_35630 [Streptomyces netropsis]|uniref:hypothetical protein n=1 Tax=Streptomyces netropsis TaxID=55404 RepID=UPI0037926EEA
MLWLPSLRRRTAPYLTTSRSTFAATATRTLLPGRAPRIVGAPAAATHPIVLLGGDELRVRALLHQLLNGGSR